MSPDTADEAAHLIDILRAELRLYGRFGRPVRLGHIARGLRPLQELLKPRQTPEELAVRS
jgi:hypothetical protein